MLTLPATTATAVVHATLINLSVNTQTFYLANTYGPIVYNSNTYTGLGHFIGLSEIQDELQITPNNINLTLSGIPKDPGEAGLGTYTSYVSLILAQKIKGSKIDIYRAFFDTVTGELDATSTSLRFSGYISNYTISDNTDIESKTDTYSVSVQCSNVLGILERKVTGRRTNGTDQKALYPTDTSMDRVVAISNTAFDFGRPYTGGGTGGGYDGGGGFPNPFDDSRFYDR